MFILIKIIKKIWGLLTNFAIFSSIISTNQCCCDSIIEYKDIYKIFINVFDKYPGNEEIIVRLTYTLGNIVAKIDNTRVKVLINHIVLFS